MPLKLPILSEYQSRQKITALICSIYKERQPLLYRSIGGLSADKSTVFTQEVDLAIAADLGSLQRLPPLIGYGMSISCQYVDPVLTFVCYSLQDYINSVRASFLPYQHRSKMILCLNLKKITLFLKQRRVAEGLSVCRQSDGDGFDC